MARGYWLKLYTDILYDPKMGRLTDVLWRRAIECFLLAKEQNENGLLPPLADMAFLLRAHSPEALESDLIELQRVGIVNNAGQGWRVVNFEKWQAPMTDAERKASSRARRSTSGSHEPVTERSQTRHVSVLEERRGEVRGEEEEEERGEENVTPPILMKAALADLTGLDIRISRNSVDLEHAAYELVNAGYTVADLRDGYGDGGWWRKHHWLGKKGERPSLKMICETVREAVDNSPRRAFARVNAWREAAEDEDDGEPMPSPGGETPAGGHDCIGSAPSS